MIITNEIYLDFYLEKLIIIFFITFCIFLVIYFINEARELAGESR